MTAALLVMLGAAALLYGIRFATKPPSTGALRSRRGARAPSLQGIILVAAGTALLLAGVRVMLG